VANSGYCDRQVTPEQFIAILTALATLIAAVTACLIQLRQTHELTNSRMTQLLAAVTAAAQMQGELAGRDFVRPKLRARASKRRARATPANDESPS
jgi:hypothetical protein